jgi:hypothetical protein
MLVGFPIYAIMFLNWLICQSMFYAIPVIGADEAFPREHLYKFSNNLFRSWGAKPTNQALQASTNSVFKSNYVAFCYFFHVLTSPFSSRAA